MEEPECTKIARFSAVAAAIFSEEFGIRWAGVVRPSWSHFGQLGVFQFLGTTRNRKLQGQHEGRGRNDMGTRGKQKRRSKEQF